MSTEEPTRTIGGLRGARRQAVDTTRLIQTSFVEGNEESMPLVVTPAVENVALAYWCASNKGELDGYFDRYGAILFRGFPLHEAADFEAVASAIAPDLFAEYGDLPPEGAS